MDDMRKLLINAGVRNLKEFGYPGVNADNILTDKMYAQFFQGMLEENRGKSRAADLEIRQLLNEIEKLKKGSHE